MILTGLETTLIGALVGMAGLSIGIVAATRFKVSKDFCKYQHEALEKLWDEKLKPINEKLDALINGHERHGWDGKDRRRLDK